MPYKFNPISGEFDYYESSTGSISGSTGSTDNAVLKADGTGGSTLQAQENMLLTDDGYFRGPNGAASNPTYSFSGSSFSGMYLTGSGVGFAFNSQLRLEIQASYISSNTTNSFSIRRLTGSAAQPIYTFDGDSNTGVYRRTDDSVGFSTAGTEAGGFDSNQVFDTTSGRVLNRTATGINYNVLITDDIVAATADGITLSLPATPTEGQRWIFKDESGAAGGTGITIDTVSTETIDGAASVSITTNYGSINIYSNGTNYFTF